ncbi:protein wech-like [Mytilus edulis]|uniref:protein wech-like n=1 Tax=Mytilus edulis TaxID=6550 RepID=UPI0039F05DA9
MADSGGDIIHCGPCEYENVTKMAAKWCSDCAEGYCDECLRLHKAAKMSRHHHLVPVSEYLRVGQMTIPQICQVHQKTYEYFCPGHDNVICILCVQSEHSKCQDLLSLQDAAKGAKTSTALNDLELNIDNLMENIENGLKFKDKNLSSILETEKSIKIAIESKHKEIIQYFERQLTKTLIELTEKYGHCQQEISSSKSTLLEIQTQLRNIKDRIFQMKTCLSDVQAFVGMKLMTGSVNTEKGVVKSLVSDMSSLVLSFEPNLKLKTIIENKETYGETTMTISNSCVTFVEPKVEQAQLKATSVNTVGGIKLKLRTAINLKYTSGSISSCFILPNKQILILDQTKQCLMIYNKNGFHDRNIVLPYKPFDATIIDHRTVAVTFVLKKMISIVDIPSNKIERNIENVNWCRGISHDNGKLYVVSCGDGISVLDLYGCSIKKYSVAVKNVFNIVTTSENVFYTDRLGNVFCLETDGSQLWQYYSSKLQNSNSSSSITTDDAGNVYIVGEQSNILITMSSKDGMNQNVLLTDRDGLKNPSAIYYNKEHKQLLICNRIHGRASLYDVRF